MKQDMIVILDLGSTENTVLARQIRDLGVYSEIHPHDITLDELKALDNVKGIILNGGYPLYRRCRYHLHLSATPQGGGYGATADTCGLCRKRLQAWCELQPQLLHSYRRDLL